MPLINQVSLIIVFYGFYLIPKTQERLTNDLRDIMREANILEELDGEKLEQENVEALKSIEGAAASNENREEKRTGDEEVDVEGVWSPRQLLQVGERKFSFVPSTL